MFHIATQQTELIPVYLWKANKGRRNCRKECVSQLFFYFCKSVTNQFRLCNLFSIILQLIKLKCI